MERTIKVTGKGKISVKPDTIRLLITMEATEKTYEAAFEESASKKQQLNQALEKLGFKKEDLKTLSFNVNTDYESYQAKDRSWKRRLLGYTYNHRMKLEFPADNTLLGKVLMVISRCPGKPEFSIQYTVADPEAAKNLLLGKAVEDACDKAAVLTSAAGLALRNIITIDYSWGEIDIISRPVKDMMLMESYSSRCMDEDNSIDMDIEADDIEVTDTVTVIWEIA